MVKKILFACAISFFSFSTINAQSQVLGGGEVHGSFQADAQYYKQDSAIGANEIAEEMAVNAFLEMRYTNKGFEAGMRYELFMPQMQGYDSRWKGNGFGYRYIRYSNDRIDVTAGNFYEQFGSGMILRSYQEWNLGFDNSMDGVRVKYKMKALTIKGLVAKQRLFWDLGPGIVRGIDGELSVNDLFKSFSDSKTRLFFGGSFVSRYQIDQNPLYNLPENVASCAGRFQIYHGGFNLKMEMAKKINDPNATNNFIYKEGNAVMAELGYSQKGLGLSLQLNRSDNMDFRSSRTATGFDSHVGYIPAMTRQHAYSLAAMYPYASQANGQMGLQATIVYKLKKRSTLGGRYGTSIDVNYSVSNSIYKQAINDTTKIGQTGTLGYSSDFFKLGDEKYYYDFNIKIQRKLSKKWNVSLMYMNVYYNMLINEGHNSPDVYADIIIGDVWWKFKPYNSLHFELQALFTEQDDGNWSSAMVEYNRKGFFGAVILLYNHGNDLAGHTVVDSQLYPFLTLGYTHKATRISAGYGKQREGIVCVGGVCRAVPASNGFSLTINSSF
ncbi:MAG: hypothetical protein KAG64_09235 [Bacteroidales bacterium]|nr:hypothetical protein [Bacteroidales bacterium]